MFTLIALRLSAESQAAVIGRCEGQFTSDASTGRSRVDGSSLRYEDRADLQVFSMKPSLVVPGLTRAIDAYVSMLAKLQAAIKEMKVSKEVTDTVLYPMSGFDLTAALVMFPHARRYVLIDNHSLMRPQDIETVRRSKVSPETIDRNGHYVDANSTGGNVFQKLVTALFANVPGAKITSIRFIVDVRQNVSLEMRFTEPTSGVEKQIFYLVGELGGVDSKAKESADRDRAYLTTLAIRRGEVPETGNWWNEMLAELAPRTIIIKGSMSALRQTMHAEHLPGRESLIAPVIEQGGLVVEGASKLTEIQDAIWARRLKKDRVRWELTDGDPRFARPAQKIEFSGIDYSYGRQVRISVHAPAKP